MRFVALLFLTLCAFSVFGQGKTLPATRAEHSIKIDGKLDEGAWTNAPVAAQFSQYFPSPGAPATTPTQVKVLYDDDAIYIGALLHDNPSEIRRQFTARDGEQMADVDFFSVYFDTYHDLQNGFQFVVTSRNVQSDVRISGAYTGVLDNVGDRSWDAVWQSQTSFTPEGWVVEMRIPYLSLRFSKKDVQNWGIQFMRFLRRNTETSFWNPVSPNVAGLVNQFGEYTGLTQLQPPLRLSFSPYLSGGVRYNPKGSAAKSPEYLRNGGMDVKWGINESFTLDATLVPDFGQVISDNVINNLSPFEVQFQENRPFFTEGTELFNKAGLFYSRRIGANPAGYSDVAYFADESEDWRIRRNPSVTQLYNAIKFSGRTKKKLGIGVFNAVTAPMNAQLYNTSTGKDSSIQTEPLTNYNILVLDQAFKGRSYLTFTNTNVLRKGSGRDANVSGIDFAAYDKTNTYVVSGFARYSKIFGYTPYSGFVSAVFDTVHKGSEVLLNPYDGYNARLRVGKVSGLWRYNVAARVFSAFYDPNDLGYLNTANQVNYTADLGYYDYEGTKRLNQFSYKVAMEYNYLYHPYRRTNFMATASAFWWFKNMWDVRVNLGVEPVDKHDYFELRTPGRYVRLPAYGYISVAGSTDSRKRLFVDYEVGFAEAKMPNNPYYTLNLGVRYRFSNKLTLRLEGIRTHDQGQIGWAFAREANGDPIGGFRNVKDVTMLATGLYNFTPRMNLSLRARHYWSNVHYRSFFNVAEDGGYIPRAALRNTDYDFNVFNIDAFYTWDFKPGNRIILGYKNWLGSDHQVLRHLAADKRYGKNLNNTLMSPHGNEITLRVIFFIDYNQLRKK
ncbi:DUF5916 domain-containing protein [Paracnuella aquatica]|uniref:DUF5916 domain-containing protein n=1 Tax=Paracnuella aquatica TaxID=2268757 RepID=UPI000DEF175C|nr:DUF5916 domain-containing protein [Paracnuella aquatica]RPD48928.1 hypothetical protein DRJ53_09720 [Paracnuella aquatica]